MRRKTSNDWQTLGPIATEDALASESRSQSDSIFIISHVKPVIYIKAEDGFSHPTARQPCEARNTDYERISNLTARLYKVRVFFPRIYCQP